MIASMDSESGRALIVCTSIVTLQSISPSNVITALEEYMEELETLQWELLFDLIRYTVFTLVNVCHLEQ